MRGIARRLDDVQLILICGHNGALAERLAAMSTAAPRLVIGFTADICYYMQLSDFFIGKPGPGSISEAIQQSLPVVVVRNAWTMPQERYNTEWVKDHNAGIVLDSFRSIRDGVAEIIGRLDEFRTSIARIQNRAIFEIPDILEQILNLDGAAGIGMFQNSTSVAGESHTDSVILH
jgi:UDP-N-acetylglucosamine:LPS N-acetylglucosamine transferase